MADVYLNQKLTAPERRSLIFDGALFLYSGLKACSSLCDYALETLREGFETPTPEVAFRDIPVEEFAKKAEWTKRKFTNSLRSKELIRQFVNELDGSVDQYYFDVPRLRIVPAYSYLHAGVSYAYAPHRDTWYGNPPFQINHWMPVMTITPGQTMAIYPAYFKRSLKNSSSSFDLTHWINVERPRAVNNLKVEERAHPLPLEDVDPGTEVRLAGNKGEVMIFSGAQLHATVPNETDITRFSVDFRLYHVDDIAGRSTIKQPPNVDCLATSDGYGLTDCFRLADFAPFEGTVQ